jgi:hypothetical protein
MRTLFNEIDGEDVYQAFPQFYDKQGRFFEIVHKGKEIGFVGIRPLPLVETFWSLFPEECELEVYIFSSYRNSLTKGLVFAVLDFPKTLGFTQSVMTTTRPGLLKLLHFLIKTGKIDIGWSAKKQIFRRIHP